MVATAQVPTSSCAGSSSVLSVHVLPRACPLWHAHAALLCGAQVQLAQDHSYAASCTCPNCGQHAQTQRCRGYESFFVNWASKVVRQQRTGASTLATCAGSGCISGARVRLAAAGRRALGMRRRLLAATGTPGNVWVPAAELEAWPSRTPACCSPSARSALPSSRSSAIRRAKWHAREPAPCAHLAAAESALIARLYSLAGR